MVRLTNRNQLLVGYIGSEIYEKLCNLEDIEEELGIDLITLFKALKNGIWTTLSYMDIHRMRYEKRQKQKYFYYDNVLITKDNLLISSSGDNTCGSYAIKFIDYGKTWALTKEELE